MTYWESMNTRIDWGWLLTASEVTMQATAIAREVCTEKGVMNTHYFSGTMKRWNLDDLGAPRVKQNMASSDLDHEYGGRESGMSPTPKLTEMEFPKYC